MSILSRWFAPLVLIAGFGGLVLVPAPVHAQSSDLARVVVDVADVVFRSGSPYYRHGQYRHEDRLIVVRDRYGRPVYYREAPRDYRSGPPYGKAHGYYRHGPGSRQVRCDHRGRCESLGRGHGKSRYYYDARYDRRDDRRYDKRYSDRRGR